MSTSLDRRLVRTAWIAGTALLALCTNAAGMLGSPVQASESGADEAGATRLESLDQVGAGELLRSDGGAFVPLPLLEVRVDLEVTGIMVRGVVTETFENPSADVIDALYVFPMPEGAAVHGMEMRIGDRRIVAVVKERAEARTVFETARREGKKASLLEQDRPNLFRTAVANIEPGERVSVRLEYLEEVAYRDGELSLALPLTFTPRYTPRSSSSTAADDALVSDSVVATGRSVFPRAAIHVRIADGLPVESVRSASHAVQVDETDRGVVVEPEGGSAPADRDFLLSWRIRREAEPGAVAFVENRPDGRYALVMVTPPIGAEEGAPGIATDTVFIVDVSGSMEGPSIAAAREVLLAAVDRLRPGDTFDLLKFDDTNEPFAGSLQPVRSDTLAASKEWIRSLEPGGGTEIVPALVRGLEMVRRGSGSHAQRVILITDGAVSNEAEAFQTVSSLVGDARVHVVGIGNAPNRYLMRKLAIFGRGACEFIDARADVGARIGSFLERIERPVMSDVTLDFFGTAPLESYPARIPDLYAGLPLVVSLKLDPAHPEVQARLGGRVLGGWIEKEIVVDATAPMESGVATRWARAKVGSLLDGLHEGADAAQVRTEVIDVATAFHLATPYTSLVAVEDLPADVAEETPCAPDDSERGLLPQGGTSGPLLLLVGLVLTAIGSMLLVMTGFHRGPVV